MGSNFFYVREGVLHTAGRGVLIGITRQTVIALARFNEIDVHYKALPLNELTSIQEAFITNSSHGIVPVVEIRGETIGNGKVGEMTRRLRGRYDEQVLSFAEDIIPSEYRTA